MHCLCRQSPLRALLASMSQLHIEPAATRLPQRIGSNLLPAYRTTSKSTFTTISQKPSTTPARNTEKQQQEKNEGGEGFRKIGVSKWESKGFAEGPRRKRPSELTEEERREHAKTRRREMHNKQEHWKIQKEALKEKFPEGWRPMKRLSPDAMAGIKALHAQYPEEYTTAKLAAMFEMSPEAIRRILRAKWEASPEEEQKRQERWFRRGVNVWSRWAEMGVKPPQKWRREGVARDKSFHENRKAAIERRQAEEAREDQGEKLQRKLGDSIM
ncbi:mitochondrion organization and biogenesis protein [Colletotrichum karsti]|uniref:Required for respiratory growth protein 9, mitochondrial n=1 Tax=Colletotrichum karsti TaxID=1095194 RepID=A0A9P6I8H3_9PEZI|nr:mitochondrion organization and biogenesis protein [Colletotrichum karsti]KAF9877672.1 mitochondrion organization and biogenesis protein [Colletotrichum karsti]